MGVKTQRVVSTCTPDGQPALDEVRFESVNAGIRGLVCIQLPGGEPGQPIPVAFVRLSDFLKVASILREEK